uniref:Uncharacterized protein n=1 Tax=Arundo donax TaxID=35708 RepID=A0A0A9F8X4_ARUDO
MYNCCSSRDSIFECTNRFVALDIIIFILRFQMSETVRDLKSVVSLFNVDAASNYLVDY